MCFFKISLALNPLTHEIWQGSDNKVEWYKVLPKPHGFEPKDREQELGGFRDWFWSLEQYIVAVDSNYATDLAFIKSHLDEEWPLVEQNAEKTKRSAFFIWFACFVVETKAINAVERC